VLHIHKSAWLLVLLSAALQILIFPLPNLYMLWLGRGHAAADRSSSRTTNQTRSSFAQE